MDRRAHAGRARVACRRARARRRLRAARRRRLRPVRQPRHGGAPRRQRADAHRRAGHRRGRAEQPGRPARRAPAHRVRRRRTSSAAARSRACSAPASATCTARCSSTTRTRSRSRSPTSAPCSPAALRAAAAVARRGRLEPDRVERRCTATSAASAPALGASRTRTSRLLALLLARRRCVLAIAGGALWLSPDRRRTVVELGIGRRGRRGRVVVAARIAARDRASHHVQGPDAQRGGRRDLGRVPRRPAHRGVDPRRRRARSSPRPRSLIRPIDVRRAAARAPRAGSRAEPERDGCARVRGARAVAAGVLVLVDRDAVLAAADARWAST